MRQIVFDLETTGFRFDQGHRIVEIGAIELVRGAITGKNFHAYVNPERDMPDDAFRVHGLSQAFLSDKPVFNDAAVAPAFVDFIGEAQLIAHNGASFDLPFLNAELKAAGLQTIEADRLYDTLHRARRKFPGAPASLDALCARFGIDTKERERDGHGALLDSRLLAEVYIELTGGAQAGLDFSRDGSGAASGGARRRVAKAMQRPAPLKPLLTDEERLAHEGFVAEMGPESLWAQRPAGQSAGD